MFLGRNSIFFANEEESRVCSLKKEKPPLPTLMNALGHQAENDALAYLIKKRFRLRDRNFHTRWGELDLVMEDAAGTIVFVEVKARMASPVGSSLEQIDAEKLRRLKRAIALYVHQRRLDNRSLRLDGVGIEYGVDQAGVQNVQQIEHVEDLTGW